MNLEEGSWHHFENEVKELWRIENALEMLHIRWETADELEIPGLAAFAEEYHEEINKRRFSLDKWLASNQDSNKASPAVAVSAHSAPPAKLEGEEEPNGMYIYGRRWKEVEERRRKEKKFRMPYQPPLPPVPRAAPTEPPREPNRRFCSRIPYQLGAPFVSAAKSSSKDWTSQDSGNSNCILH